jgi:MFS family permease
MSADPLVSRPLWRDSSFVLFWSGRAVSLLGTAITSVVLPILVYQLTASAFLTALLTTGEALPYLLAGLFAGALADRIDRRKLMVGCDLFNTVALGSIPLAGALHVLTIPQLFLVAVLTAAAFVWFDAADFGALPTLVGRGRLVEASSAMAAISSVMGIAGPALGGVLTTTIGPVFSLSIDSVSYLCSAVSLLLIPRALSALTSRSLATSPRSRWRIWGDIRDGLRFLWRQRLVRVLTLLSFGLSFTGGAVNGLLVIYAVQGLGLSATDARIGWLFATSALGSFVASLLLAPLTKRLPTGWTALATLSLNLLFLLLLVWCPSPGLALAWFAGYGWSYTLTTTNGIALRQLVIPDQLQSRVNATARMIAWGGAPFGAAIGGILVQVTTIRVAYLIMAGGVALSVLVGWCSPLRAPTMARKLAQEAPEV